MGITRDSFGYVWAVGYHRIQDYPNPIIDRMLVMKWDGGSWTQVVPNVQLPIADASYYLTSIDEDGNGGIWAAGYYRDATGFLLGGFSMRWDGSNWDIQQVGDVDIRATGVSKVASEVRVGGDSVPKSQANAFKWTPQTNWFQDRPAAITNTTFLGASYTPNTSESFMVGYRQITYPTLSLSSKAYYNDGTTWHDTNSEATEPAGQGAALFSVKAFSSTNVWAVGQYFDAQGRIHTLIKHYTTD